MQKTRYWVVLNNQFRPPPEAVRPDWRSVLPRGLDASSRSATVSAMRHLFSLAAVLRIEYGADVGSPCCANCKPDGCAPRGCRPAPDQICIRARVGIGSILSSTRFTPGISSTSTFRPRRTAPER